jgi:hypothetical protein
MPVDGKTTSKTLESHQQEVVLEKLPRTMRDAVEVTVSWLIPYIWIDALCIIQDDTLDRNQESGDMALVYSHATATIAAAISDHCDGGSLSDSFYRMMISLLSKDGDQSSSKHPSSIVAGPSRNANFFLD